MNLSAEQFDHVTTPTTEIITPQYRRYAMLLLVLVFTSSHVDRQILAILLQPIKLEPESTDKGIQKEVSTNNHGLSHDFAVSPIG